jgi:hypothetical protein
MKFTEKEELNLKLAFAKLEEFYLERILTCKAFKNICNQNLPQIGEGYTLNKNVFDIEEKTISDINKQREEAKQLLIKLLKND